MEPIDILLIVALSVLVVGIVARLLLRKKQGKASCGCSCQGCPSAGACHAAKKAQSTGEKPEGDTHV